MSKIKENLEFLEKKEDRLKVGLTSEFDILVDEFGNSWYDEKRIPRVSDFMSGNLEDRAVSFDSHALRKGRVGHDYVFGEKLDNWVDLDLFFSLEEIENLKKLKEMIEFDIKNGFSLIYEDKHEHRFMATNGVFIYTGLRDTVLYHKDLGWKYYDLKTGEDSKKYDIQSYLYSLPEFGEKQEFIFFFSKTGNWRKGRVFDGDYANVEKMYNDLFYQYVNNLSPVERYLVLKKELESAKEYMYDYLESLGSKKIENEKFKATWKDEFEFKEKPREGGKTIIVKGSWTVKKI